MIREKKKPKRLTKRVRGWIGDTITGKKDQSINQSINQSIDQSVPIDLSSTLSKFSQPNFHAESFVNTHFLNQSINQSKLLSSELINRKDQTRSELQSYVSSHHQSFIETSNHILSLESDMIASCALLQSINQSINQMMTSSFKYSDEKLFHRAQEQEKNTRKMLESQQSINQSINEWNECLRSYIYERRFEEAVEIIETADQSINQSINQSDNLSARRCQLIETLCTELSVPNLSKSDRRRLIDWLIRCHAIDQALTIYLSINQSNIKNEMKHVVFVGSLIDYVRQLSEITAKCLIETMSESAKLFNQSNNQSTNQSINQSINLCQYHSSVVVWCEDEIRQFCLLISRQVFLPDQSFQSINQSIECIFDCFQSIDQRGFSCCHLLSFYLSPLLSKYIQQQYAVAIQQINQSINEEEWQSEQVLLHAPNQSIKQSVKQSNNQSINQSIKSSKVSLSLTPSARLLYDWTRQFLSCLMPFFTSSLSFYHSIHPSINQSINQCLIDGLIDFIQSYVVELSRFARSGMTDYLIDERQSISIIANIYYLLDDLLIRVRQKVNKLRAANNQSINQSINHFTSQIIQFNEQLLTHFYTCQSNQLIDQVLEWKSMMKIEYANPHEIPITQSINQSINQSVPIWKSLGISVNWLRVYDRCDKIREISHQLFPSQAAHGFVSVLIEQLIEQLINQSTFDRENADHAFGYGGCMQFTRDLTFFLCVWRNFATAACSELKDELLDLARANYVQATGANEEETSEIQDQHIQDVERKMEEKGQDMICK